MLKENKEYEVKVGDLHFWPCKKNIKMDSTYENVGYTAKELDYHDFILKEYFFNYDSNGNIIYPFEESTKITEKTPIIGFTNLSRNVNTITITLDYKEWKEEYDKYIAPDFNLLKINYFVSDFNALNNKIKWSFWFVDNVNLIYDQTTLQPIKFNLDLQLDEYSTFYNAIWNYSGIVNILRQHNQRWVQDTIFKSGMLIPDFASNQFIRNCDEVCSRWTEKIQQTQTSPLISSRHWNWVSGLPQNSDFLEWVDTTKIDSKVKSKKVMVLLWCMRVNQTDESKTQAENPADFTYYMGEITNLSGYSIPLRLIAYISSANDEIVIQKELNDLINRIQVKGIPRVKNETKLYQYRIVNASISENLWKEHTFVPLLDEAKKEIPNAYTTDDGNLDYYSTQSLKEYFFFLDNVNSKKVIIKDENGNDKEIEIKYGDLWNKIFKTQAEIIQQKTFDKFNYSNLEIEPHLFTNNHFSSTIQLFNQNGITFDISTLLINNNDEFDHIDVKPNQLGKYYNFQIVERKGTISPDYNDVKYFLLDRDTSVAYKRDNNVMSISMQGTYTWPFYDQTYNEWVRNNQHQRQAGYDNIQQQYKAGQQQMWIQNGKSWFSGLFGGAMGGGNLGGIAGGILGGLGGLFGAGINSAFDMSSKQIQLDTQKETAERSLNAQYEDAKNMKGNINGGSPQTTQADIRFSFNKDDDKDPRNYKSIWTPSITFMQVKNYDAYTIAIYLNKNGYPQNRWQAIDSLNDLMIRKFWNKLQISNADEFFKKDAIQIQYVYNFLTRLISKGIRFWNLEEINYEDIFNYEINNYEKNLESDITTLQSKGVD